MKDFKGKQKTAKDLLKGCSYAKGGKVHKPKEGSKAEEAKESSSEKKQEAKAKKEVGKVDGKVSKNRLDKLARGGKAKGHKAKTQVNVMVQPGQQKVPVPVAVKTPVPIAPNGVNPMPAGPGMGGAPVAGMPGQNPMKKGGKVKRHKRAMGGKVPHMDAGAGGGLGRLEKAKDAAKKPKKENE